MIKKALNLVFSIFLFASFAQAQAAEITVSLNEQFFDALLDAVFKNFDAPEFPLAAKDSKFRIPDSKNTNVVYSYQTKNQSGVCKETIRLQREIDGVRTAVRFRDGKIFAPIAFSGSYNPPLVGCINFQGWAETNINLEYDKQNQKLVGKVQVTNVNLSGTGGFGGSLLSRVVQNAIDKRVNPIEILSAEQLSFLVPMRNSGDTLKMKSVAVRPEIKNNILDVRIAYEFSKGN